MIILKTSIQTTRAFIRYKKIQHISWEFREHKTKALVKIHTSANDTIIEECTIEDYNEFLKNYKIWAADMDNYFQYSIAKGDE